LDIAVAMVQTYPVSWTSGGKKIKVNQTLQKKKKTILGYILLDLIKGKNDTP